MTLGVSVVAPVHAEAGVLLELARRCVVAARSVDPMAEVLLVDDASTDGTQELVAQLPVGVRVIRLERNVGQFAATKHGLQAALGAFVVVLDGDLQDPPEVLVSLLARLRASPAVDVVFAVKEERAEGPVFRAARFAYDLWARVPGSHIVPSGAGAYCAMRRDLARRVAAVGVDRANLAAVLMALGARADTVPYRKVARYDGRSRVGPAGLLAEGAGSLILTGALGVALRALSLALFLGGLLSRRRGWVTLAVGTFLAGVEADRRARRALREGR